MQYIIFIFFIACYSDYKLNWIYSDGLIGKIRIMKTLLNILLNVTIVVAALFGWYRLEKLKPRIQNIENRVLRKSVSIGITVVIVLCILILFSMLGDNMM